MSVPVSDPFIWNLASSLAESYLVGERVRIIGLPGLADGDYLVTDRVPPRLDGSISVVVTRA